MFLLARQIAAWYLLLGAPVAATTETGPQRGVIVAERRRSGSARRAGVDRRKNPGRRRTDRGETPQARSTGQAAPGQLRFFNSAITRIERRRGDRRDGTDRRRSTDRRAALTEKPAAHAKGARRTRLVPCAPDSAWLNTDQAARHLGIPRRGLYRLLSEGAIRGHRKSGKDRGFILFERAALDTFIRTRRSP